MSRVGEVRDAGPWSPPGRIAGLLLLCLAAGAGGCEPDVHHFQLCTVSSVQGGSVTTEQIRIPQGAVVAVKLMPYDMNGRLMDQPTWVTAQPTHPSILGVRALSFQTVGCPGPDDAPWYFVLHGVSPGQTTLTLHAGGSEGAQIPVTVTEP